MYKAVTEQIARRNGSFGPTCLAGLWYIALLALSPGHPQRGFEAHSSNDVLLFSALPLCGTGEIKATPVKSSTFVTATD